MLHISPDPTHRTPAIIDRPMLKTCVRNEASLGQQAHIQTVLLCFPILVNQAEQLQEECSDDADY